MQYLRHGLWAYDAVNRVVTARFPNGEIKIPVCTQKHPRVGAFFINRRDEDQWVIAPTACFLDGNTFSGRVTPFDSDGVHCEFVTLTGAPSHVNVVLGDLYEETADDTPTQRLCPRCDARGFTSDGECSLCNGTCAISPVDAVAWEKLTR